MNKIIAVFFAVSILLHSEIMYLRDFKQNFKSSLEFDIVSSKYEKLLKTDNPTIEIILNDLRETLYAKNIELDSYALKNETVKKIVISSKITTILKLAANIDEISNEITVKMIDEMTDLINKNNVNEKITSLFYYDLISLYIKKEQYEKANLLAKESLSGSLSETLKFGIIRKFYNLTDKKYVLSLYPFIQESLKKYSTKYSFLLQSLVFFKEFNGVEYENGKRIDIKGIIDNIPNDFLDKESDYITKKTIQQTINDLELNNFKSLDEISEFVRNKNSDNKFFVILLMVILGGFLIKNRKKKKIIKDKNIELNY